MTLSPKKSLPVGLSLKQLITSLVVIIFMIFILLFIKQFFDRSKFSLHDIEVYIDAQLPQDASSIVFEGEHGIKPYFKLNFRASPKSINDFLSNICDGVIHQGYDPFNAIDTSQAEYYPLYIIKMQTFTYYSYSSNISSSIWGNRCWPEWRGIYQVLVDKTNPHEYSLTLEMPKDCEKAATCSPIGDNYVEPVPDLPLIVIGMEQQESDYILASNEICIEMQLGYVLSTGWTQVDKWKNLIGANLDILIDQKSLKSAYISEGGRLTRVDNKPNSFRYDYCFTENWLQGKHSMVLQIETSTGQKSEYSWDFFVE